MAKQEKAPARTFALRKILAGEWGVFEIGDEVPPEIAAELTEGVEFETR